MSLLRQQDQTMLLKISQYIQSLKDHELKFLLITSNVNPAKYIFAWITHKVTVIFLLGAHFITFAFNETIFFLNGIKSKKKTIINRFLKNDTKIAFLYEFLICFPSIVHKEKLYY